MKKIVFFIGSPDISGGTYVIFQHALFLSENGYDVTIVTQNPFSVENLLWHPATKVLPIYHIDDLSKNFKCDLVFATWWKTALELHRIRAQKYAYFVQSIESRFYPEQEKPLRQLVDDTYLLPLPIITEATWIKNYLTEKYQRDVKLVKNGIRKDLYTANGETFNIDVNNLRILIEGPLGVSFKNVEKTISLVAKANVGEIWLLTSSDVNHYSGVDKVFSRVPITEVPKIYRSCDILVKLSYVEGMFGPPLEMFHCGGTAIVYNVTGHDEYIMHNHNAFVIDCDDENAVIRSLQQLKRNPELLKKLKNGAMDTANKWANWDQSSLNYLDATLEILNSSELSDISSIKEMNSISWNKYVKNENIRLSGSIFKKIKLLSLNFFRKIKYKVK